ncbi:MAG: hypothetical protein GXO26_00915 [Crenarchaeota archaeon]|nr:hypothetical protein [Thermoproteota archaeon]
MKEAKELGLSTSEIAELAEDFDTLFTQVLGTHGLPKKPNGWAETGKRILKALNYVTFGGGFGITALTDFGNVAAKTGLKNTLMHIKPALKAIKDLRKIGKGDLRWVEDAMAIGAAADYYNMRVLSRLDDVDGVVIANRADRALGSLSTTMTKWSGLGPITAIEEIVAVGAGTVDMFKRATKLAETGHIDEYYMKQLARYGLDESDLLWLAKQPVKIENGVLIDFNFKNWDNPKRTQKIQEGLTRVMEDAIIRGDKTLLPKVMTTDNPLGQLMFQFMTFPVVAHERLLLAGLSEQSARFYVGIMTSMGITASFYYVREQALIAAGIIDERDAKYDIIDEHGTFDEEALTNLAVLMVSKTGQFGFAPDVLSKGLAFAGIPMPGRSYPETAYTAIGGVSASRFDALHRAMKGMYDGSFDSYDGVKLAQQYLPFANLWQLNQVYNPILEKELR